MKIEIHKRSLERSKALIDNWKVSQKEKQEFKRFLDEGFIGLVNVGTKLDEGTLYKYTCWAKTPLEYFSRQGWNVTRLIRKHTEQFYKDVISDKIKKEDKGVYSDDYKAGFGILLKIYLCWRLGKAKGEELTEFWDCRVRKRTPNYLKEEEVEKLYKGCNKDWQRFLISLLFDSGARAGEIHNLRYEDILLPKGDVQFIKICLKEEYSKTKGRTISLYWKHSNEAVRDYLKERQEEGIKPNEAVLNINYDMGRAFLRRLGQTQLKKRVHYHLMRHSSTTYNASKMNRQQLCVRYGWAFSSPMPDVYISRAGVDSKELDDKMAGVEIEKVKENFRKKEEEMKLKQEQTEEKLNTLLGQVDEITKILSNHPMEFNVGKGSKVVLYNSKKFRRN